MYVCMCVYFCDNDLDNASLYIFGIYVGYGYGYEY